MKPTLHPCTAAACALLSVCALQPLTAAAAEIPHPVLRTAAAEVPQTQQTCTWKDGVWDIEPQNNDNLVLCFSADHRVFDFALIPQGVIPGTITAEGPADGTVYSLSGTAMQYTKLNIRTNLTVPAAQIFNASESAVIDIADGCAVTLPSDINEALNRGFHGGTLIKTGKGTLTMQQADTDVNRLNGTVADIRRGSLGFKIVGRGDSRISGATLKFAAGTRMQSHGWLLAADTTVHCDEGATVEFGALSSAIPSLANGSRLTKTGAGTFIFTLMHPKNEPNRSVALDIREGTVGIRGDGAQHNANLTAPITGSGTLKLFRSGSKASNVTLASSADTGLTLSAESGCTLTCPLTPEQQWFDGSAAVANDNAGNIRLLDTDGKQLEPQNGTYFAPEPLTVLNGTWPELPNGKLPDGCVLDLCFTEEGRTCTFPAGCGMPKAIRISGSCKGTVRLTDAPTAYGLLRIESDTDLAPELINKAALPENILNIPEEISVTVNTPKDFQLNKHLSGKGTLIKTGAGTLKFPDSVRLTGITADIRGGGIYFNFPVLKDATLRFGGEATRFSSYGWLGITGVCTLYTQKDINFNGASFEGNGTLRKTGPGSLSFDFIDARVPRNFSLDIREGEVVSRNAAGTLLGPVTGPGTFRVQKDTVTLPAPAADTRLVADKDAAIRCILTPEQVNETGYTLPAGWEGKVDFCTPDGRVLAQNPAGTYMPATLTVTDGQWPGVIPDNVTDLTLKYTSDASVNVTVPESCRLRLNSLTITGPRTVSLFTSAENLTFDSLTWEGILGTTPDALSGSGAALTIPEYGTLALLMPGDLKRPVTGKGTLQISPRGGTVTAAVSGQGLNGMPFPATVSIARGSELNLTVNGSDSKHRILLPQKADGAGTLRLTAGLTETDVCNGSIAKCDLTAFTGTLAVTAPTNRGIRLKITDAMMPMPMEAGKMSVRVEGNRAQLITNVARFAPNLFLNCDNTHEGYPETYGIKSSFGALRVFGDTEFAGSVVAEKGTVARIGEAGKKTFTGTVSGEGSLLFGQTYSSNNASSVRFRQPVKTSLILRNNGTGSTDVIAEQGVLGNVTFVGSNCSRAGLVIGNAETVTERDGTVCVLGGFSVGGTGTVKTLSLAEGAVLDATRGAPTVTGAVSLPDTVLIRKSAADSTAPVLIVTDETARSGLLDRTVGILTGTAAEPLPGHYFLSADPLDATHLLALTAAVPVPEVVFNGEKTPLPTEFLKKLAALSGGTVPKALNAASHGGSVSISAELAAQALDVFEGITVPGEDGTLALTYDFGIRTFRPTVGEDGKTYMLAEAKICGPNGADAAYADGTKVRLLDADGNVCDDAEPCDANGSTAAPAAETDPAVRWFRLPCGSGTAPVRLLKAEAVR